jgi:hypothetical protein
MTRSQGHESVQDERVKRVREERDEEHVDEEQDGNSRARPRLPGSKAIAIARQHLQELTGQVPEAVSGLHSQQGRWKVTLDMVELERIPHTTDVMASYEIELDERGQLLAYSRVGRYYRSQVDQG